MRYGKRNCFMTRWKMVCQARTRLCKWRRQLDYSSSDNWECTNASRDWVFNFDSKAESLYQYLPEWHIYKQNEGEEVSRELKELLFQPGSSNKERKELNILPKLRVVIGGHHIIPRSSDKGMVRVYEVRVLNALVEGI
ncbi:hypothetical protein L1987_83554 [Smallanthus sonchifolius]|uniref:Uncharacterized protein n=1 Tax=Smallanthus sonchifolius TaxID=185202 RepID=A0ACB8YBM7_9ASTR|nr:hypothetical protein L1987_83554 [Smallanthus sonchifolius]